MMRIKEIKKVYTKKGLTESQINIAIRLDESPTKKYVQYIVSQKLKGHCMYDTYALIKYFEGYLPYIDDKDIYSQKYIYLKDLEAIIEVAKLKKQLKDISKKIRKKIYIFEETDEYIFLYPKNFLAARKYGYNTRWCVTQNDSYFDDYKKNIAYIIFKVPMRHQKLQKIALHQRKISYAKPTIFDSEDNTVDLNILKHMLIKSDGTYININIDEILYIYKNFIRRNIGGWYKRFLPWTLKYKTS